MTFLISALFGALIGMIIALMEAYQPVRWERDLAMEQLQSYGVGFAEDKELAEVKHGEWKKPADELKCFKDRYVICSECNVMIPTIVELDEYCYCPRCGVKMDGGGEK